MAEPRSRSCGLGVGLALRQRQHVWLQLERCFKGADQEGDGLQSQIIHGNFFNSTMGESLETRFC